LERGVAILVNGTSVQVRVLLSFFYFLGKYILSYLAFFANLTFLADDTYQNIC